MNAIYMDEKETVDEPESVLLQIKRHIAGVLRHGGESLLSVPLDKIVVHRLNIHETAANRSPMRLMIEMYYDSTLII